MELNANILTNSNSQDSTISLPKIPLNDWLSSVLEEQKGNKVAKKLMKEFEENLEDLYRLERNILLAPDEEFDALMEEIQRLNDRIREIETVFRTTKKMK